MGVNPVTFAARSFRPRQGARCFRTGTSAYPASGSVRSEQRRRGGKEPPPGGLRRIWPGASLLVGHSPTGGDAPSSRLAPCQNGRNKCHQIYAHGHLLTERQVSTKRKPPPEAP